MEKITNGSAYNKCFVMGGKGTNKNGNTVKAPGFIDETGFARPLWGGTGVKKDKRVVRYYQLSYAEAKKMISDYYEEKARENNSFRVSLWLDDAKYGDLHIFVIDFDEIDESSDFFNQAKNLADKVTRSQGGGYHMFYGIKKETAEPMFDSINLLCGGESFVCKTGCVSLDGKNKVDLFCDSSHLIYEWEEWDNEQGLTDKTQPLFELLRDNFSFQKSNSSGGKGSRTANARGATTKIADLTEAELLSRMNPAQKEIFADLKTYSPDCDRKEWWITGIDIYCVFGKDLGGEVFLYWSKPGHSFNVPSCTTTWGNICAKENHKLYNSEWDEILMKSTCVF